MVIFIPIKQNSQRVPGKNFRDFGEIPLYKHTLYKFNDHKIYVDTDSEIVQEEIANDDKLSHVTCIKRKNSLIGDEVSVCDLIANFVASKNINEPIAQIHVTSPFLNKNTLEDAYSKMKEYDSVVSCNLLQTRLWRKESYGYCPINHNPMKLEQTQDLPVYYEENSSFYIFNPNIVFSGTRIGKNPFFFPINYPENLDIDTESDWDMCIKLKKRKK